MREKILLIILKKEFFCIKVMYLKQKKKKNRRRIRTKIKDGFKKFIEYIENESKGIDYDFLKKLL